MDTIANAPKNANDNPLSKIEMFITYIGSNDTVPNPPTLTLPANNAINVDTMSQVQLKWAAVSDGIIYRVELSTDSTFATITNTLNTGNLLYVTPSVLPSNTKYFWRVRTNNGGHFSVYSPVSRFTTTSPNAGVGIKKQTINSTQPLIYPNPSNGKFTFTDIEKGSYIEVFDISGKLIYETTTKESATVIDLEGKEKGVYTYRITNAKQEVSLGKLIIK